MVLEAGKSKKMTLTASSHGRKAREGEGKREPNFLL
jgi:hypothetical protein